MPRDPRYDILFEPLKIGAATAPNRFVAMQLAEIDPTSEADAVRIVNATPYGLASAAWTANLLKTAWISLS